MSGQHGGKIESQDYQIPFYESAEGYNRALLRIFNTCEFPSLVFNAQIILGA
jgi:hypothetical protein